MPVFREEWVTPIWEGTLCYRETFAMIGEGGTCRAPFLWAPSRVLRVESYDGTVCYEEGRDYRIEGTELLVPRGSRIPVTDWGSWVYPDRETAALEGRGNEFAEGFGPMAAAGGGFLNLCAVGHPERLTAWQVAVTYEAEHKELSWTPTCSLERLPRLVRKLQAKDPVTVVLYGDSISCGYDCSGLYGQEPQQPVWAELLQHEMHAKWGAQVQFQNTSLGGADSDWAIRNAGERVCDLRPDLVILGFGMNDRCGAAEYREKTRMLMETIRRESPEAEFLLIATTLPNALARTAPHYFCAHQDEYSEGLRELTGSGIALADVQALQKEMEKRKRYIDLTGNWLNHPNDYLARVQGQVVLKALGL